MSDSDEVISSDEGDTTGPMSESGDKSELPSEELTIQDSDSDSADESVVVRRPRRSAARKKRAVIVDSDTDEAHNKTDSSNSEEVASSDDEEDEDEEEEEEQFERRVLSPRTRMSITGVRPADLSDSSEIYLSTVESGEEEDEQDERDKSGSKLPRSNLTEYRDVTLQEASESDSDEVPGSYLKNSFLEKSAAEGSSAKSSFDHTEESNASIEQDEETKTVNESIKANIPNRLNRINTAQTVVDSPMSSARYSMQFERAIKEKLSSTICQESPRPIQRSPVESDESDVQVVSVREPTINISSSDGESDENVLSKANPAASAVEVPKFKAPLLQPKITSQLPPKGGTPKAAAKLVEYVSQEFFDKELKKLQELKMELHNAEKLVEKISKSLPDGGHQLTLRVERLRREVSLKEQKLALMKVEDANNPSTFKTPSLPAGVPKKKAFFNSGAPTWDELSAAVNQIQPVHTGKQGMATFNTQRELTVERLKDLHSSLESCPTEDVLADDPKGLKVTLMDHQKHALAWMNWREKQKPRGGILADDMGLGKTLTMIALVLDGKNREDDNEDHENDSPSSNESDGENESERWTSKGRRSFYHGGTLVVCPASLVRQWEGEVESKVKRHKLTVCVHHGNNRDTKPKHLRTYDIVVTTYNIVGRELKSEGALFGIKWRRVILDEAHVVRNHKAQMSIAVCRLRGRYRWALTGTPIQNKEMDVFALLKFLRCSPFDELPHWKKWIDNKSAGGQQRLNALMKSLMLRRTKALLQERGSLQCLPQKRIELIAVDLDKNEMNVYQKIMVYSRTLFAQFMFQRAERNTDLMYVEQGNRPTFMQSKDPNGAYYKVHQKFTKLHQGTKEVKSHEILVLLLRLRQICCHPGLIDSMLEDADNIDSDSDSDNQQKIDLLEQLNKLAITDNSPQNSLEGDDALKPEEEIMARASAKVLQRSNPVFDLKRPSSKMIKIIETLKNCVLLGNDKAIVVSQWTSVLNILRSHLESQGIVTLSLNGSIPVKNRQAIVTDFNDADSNKRVLLLSLTAGGVGLNLVGANHLLLIDLHWNPQLEAQAQDRIYRVGQKKNVVIYKFMCKDTVEERIKALQEHKMAIADGVLTGVRAAEGSKLTMEDLRGLFGM